MISRHCKTYNFFHRVLLLLNRGCEGREAVCLTRASPLLLRVLDKIHLQGTDTWVLPCDHTSGKPPPSFCFVEKYLGRQADVSVEHEEEGAVLRDGVD